MINTFKLKAKIVENQTNVEELSKKNRDKLFCFL